MVYSSAVSFLESRNRCRIGMQNIQSVFFYVISVYGLFKLFFSFLACVYTAVFVAFLQKYSLFSQTTKDTVLSMHTSIHTCSLMFNSLLSVTVFQKARHLAISSIRLDRLFILVGISSGFKILFQAKERTPIVLSAVDLDCLALCLLWKKNPGK